jgi:mRNA interferase RelE/StbE
MSGYRVEFSDDARHTLRKLRDAKLQKRLIS